LRDVHLLRRVVSWRRPEDVNVERHDREHSRLRR
jgi:hypothetical protein